MILIAALLQLALAGLAAAAFTISTAGNTLSFVASDTTLSAGYITGADFTPIIATGLSLAGTASLGLGTGVIYVMDTVEFNAWSAANPFPDAPTSYMMAQTVRPNSIVTATTSFPVVSGRYPYLFFVYCPTGLNPSGCGSVRFNGQAVFSQTATTTRTTATISASASSSSSSGSTANGGTSGNNDDTGLSLGAIIGIVVAAIVAAIAVVSAIFIFQYRRKSRGGNPQQPPPSQQYPQYPQTAVAPSYPSVTPQQPQAYPYDPRASYMPPPQQQQQMYDPRGSWLPPPSSIPSSPVTQQYQPSVGWVPGTTLPPPAPAGLSSSGSTAQQGSDALPPPPAKPQEPSQQYPQYQAYNANAYIPSPQDPRA